MEHPRRLENADLGQRLFYPTEMRWVSIVPCACLLVFELDVQEWAFIDKASAALLDLAE
jgi:hypothetical protein